MTGTPDVPVPAAGAVPAGALILPATLVLGVAAQGAFYLPGRFVLGAGVGLSLAASLAGPRPRPGRPVGEPFRRRAGDLAGDLAWPPVVAVTALGVWIALNGVLHGTAAAGVAGASLALAVAAVLVVTRRSTAAEREVLLSALLLLGGLVAVTAWLGLVLHLPRWSLAGGGVWRGSGVLTYPNATAAVLVALSMLAAARSAAPGRKRPGTPPVGRGTAGAVPPGTARLLAAVMLLGAGTTASRGGLLAFAGGVAVLVALGSRSMLRAVAAPSAGAAVGLAGLLPVMTSRDVRGVPVAVVAAAAGIAVTWCAGLPAASSSVPEPGEEGRRARRAIAVAVLVLAGGVAVGGLVLAGPHLHAVAEARMRIDSAPRAGAALAALREIRADPVVGVGPAHPEVHWHGADGASRTARYLHDEYLQVLLEHGAVGAGLLLALLGCGARAVAVGGAPAGDRRTGGATRAGGAAALTALALHSAVDFLWHLPVLPLLAAALFAAVFAPVFASVPGPPGEEPGDGPHRLPVGAGDPGTTVAPQTGPGPRAPIGRELS